MSILEQRRHTEWSGPVRTKSSEHIVGKKNILLHLSSNILHSPWIGETQCFPPHRERAPCITDRRDHHIALQVGRQKFFHLCVPHGARGCSLRLQDRQQIGDRSQLAAAPGTWRNRDERIRSWRRVPYGFGSWKRRECSLFDCCSSSYLMVIALARRQVKTVR